MPSIAEVITEVTSLKATSEQLSMMFRGAGQDIQKSTRVIAELVKGSRTGQDAVASLSVASKSLLDAAASVLTLSNSCDECIAELSK